MTKRQRRGETKANAVLFVFLEWFVGKNENEKDTRETQ